MRPPAFRAALHHHDGWVCLALEGALDQDGVAQLDALAWPLLGRYDGDQIVFDCTEVTELEEAGAAELLRLSRALGPGERPILRNLAPRLVPRIENVDEHFQREIDLTETPAHST